jgi:hypothetical protein
VPGVSLFHDLHLGERADRHGFGINDNPEILGRSDAFLGSGHQGGFHHLDQDGALDAPLFLHIFNNRKQFGSAHADTLPAVPGVNYSLVLLSQKNNVEKSEL